ncbi:MAG TPA: DUF3040 domain-containing protein [Jatrophihabitantaceae bacterium]|jgi:hypothetical protein
MFLTNHERRELARLERALYRDDPALADMLDRFVLPPPEHRLPKWLRWLHRS